MFMNGCTILSKNTITIDKKTRFWKCEETPFLCPTVPSLHSWVLHFCIKKVCFAPKKEGFSTHYYTRTEIGKHLTHVINSFPISPLCHNHLVYHHKMDHHRYNHYHLTLPVPIIPTTTTNTHTINNILTRPNLCFLKKLTWRKKIWHF